MSYSALYKESLSLSFYKANVNSCSRVCKGSLEKVHERSWNNLETLSKPAALDICKCIFHVLFDTLAPHHPTTPPPDHPTTPRPHHPTTPPPHGPSTNSHQRSLLARLVHVFPEMRVPPNMVSCPTFKILLSTCCQTRNTRCTTLWPMKEQTQLSALVNTRQEGRFRGKRPRLETLPVVRLYAIGTDGRCCWPFPHCAGLRWTFPAFQLSNISSYTEGATVFAGISLSKQPHSTP